jgi:aminomethyltransferase
MAKTSLYPVHLASHGHLVDFHGWDLPLYYADIRSEHLAVRRHAGLFDLSHMGRLRVSGSGAEALLERCLTQGIGAMPVGRCRYSLVLDEAGHVLDDVLVYREPAAFFLVVNASNRPKILAWLGRHKTTAVSIEDLTGSLALIAIQGPRSADILQPLAGADVSALNYYTFREARPNGGAGMISRTGYTGEDGFEIYLPAADAPACWEALMKAGAGRGLLPIGLGARDTLRLEAGMPLYGHELDEQTNPLEAGLDWAVKFTKDFIGRAALEKVKAAGPSKRLVGLEVADKRIPRQGYPVLKEGKPVGVVTSGTVSPLTGRTIAMAYVAPAEAAVGNALEIEVRGTGYPAKVVPLPFYKREKPGQKTGA